MAKIRKTLQKYSEEATIHGVRYIGWSEVSKFGKIVWFIIVGIAITISIAA